MQIDKNTTAAFSGHRSFKMTDAQGDLFGSGNGDMSGLSDRVTKEIRSLIENGYDTFLCGMAEGFDLLAGEAVRNLKKEHCKIRLIAVIPHPGQAGSFKDETLDTFEKILEAADMQVTVCNRYSHDCYHRRNDFLVDNSSALVCYYNGTKGGTAYTVKRALKCGLTVKNIFCSETL